MEVFIPILLAFFSCCELELSFWKFLNVFERLSRVLTKDKSNAVLWFGI